MKINDIELQTILDVDLLHAAAQECVCGMSIFDGWKPLVSKCIRKVLFIMKMADCGDIVFDQIKEKFGRLHIYYHFENGQHNQKADFVQQIVDDIICMAERDSLKTCEYTGERGSLYIVGGWIKTLSDKKAEELNAQPYKLPWLV